MRGSERRATRGGTERCLGATHDGPWALVLAGGEGKRLQPLTRAIAGVPIPKQYCRIAGDRSLLEATLARIRPLVPPARTLVVIDRSHVDLAFPQLAGLPRENVLLQPGNHDTGPGIVFGLLHLARREPRAPVAIFPSDHYVGDGGRFRVHVANAMGLVDRRPATVALLGIRATHADTGYGYIEPGRPIAPPHEGSPAAYRVRAFHEKPSRQRAAVLTRKGCLWNSFVMVFRAHRLLALLEIARGEDVARMRGVVESATGYDTVAPWNFSHGFLSRVPEQLTVVPVDGFAWSDWGTPEAVERTLGKVRIRRMGLAPVVRSASVA